MPSISDCQYLKGIVSKRSSRTTRTHFNNLVFLTFDPIYRWDSYDRGRLCQEGKTRTCNDATISGQVSIYLLRITSPSLSFPSVSKAPPILACRPKVFNYRRGLLSFNATGFNTVKLFRPFLSGIKQQYLMLHITLSYNRLHRLSTTGISRFPCLSSAE